MTQVFNAPHPGLTLRIEASLGAERGSDAPVWQAEQRFKKLPMRVQPAPVVAT